MTVKLLQKVHTEKQSFLYLLPYSVAKQLHYGSKSQIFIQCSDFWRSKDCYIYLFIYLAPLLNGRYQCGFSKVRKIANMHTGPLEDSV